MILLFHKVAPVRHSQWWVTVDSFDRQLADLRAYDVVLLDDYDPENPAHAVITFDGVYQNVREFALPILRKWGYPFELFVIGQYVGKQNTFDQHIEPPTAFASTDDLDLLVRGGGRIQWHTSTHVDLDSLTERELEEELEVTDELRDLFDENHFGWFAYPHGRVSPRVVDEVRQRFRGAVGVHQETRHDRYNLARQEVSDSTSLRAASVSVVIPNYNYGQFLNEAVDSVIRQTQPPDEILIIDDASTDNSAEIALRHTDIANVIINERNLGIVENFRKAVSLTSGDYVVILGADNRMRSDFIEKTKAVLDSTPEAAIAYSDMTIFGPRSHVLAERVGASPTPAGDVYVWRFPDATAEQAGALLEGENFIHGSALYRRADYVQVGGYRRTDGPEDHDLWARILASGRRAVRVPAPLIEYRQHSELQANTVLSMQMEAAYARNRIKTLEEELASVQAQLAKAIEGGRPKRAYRRTKQVAVSRFPSLRRISHLKRWLRGERSSS